MKKENLEKLKKSVKAQPKEEFTAYYERYKEKFGHYPMIPITMSYGLGNDDFKKMCEEAIERGTPLTDEDYDRYFPPVKPKNIFDTILY